MNVLGVILGVAATQDVRIVIAAGLAATFAESISMGAVAYTSTVADIVGGDFNSFAQSDVKEIENADTQTGFRRVSEGCGYTVMRYGIKVTTDHIFAKGFVLEKTGKLEEATASDHLPVWVTLQLQ